MNINIAKRFHSKTKHKTSEQQKVLKKLSQEGKKTINLGRGNPDQATFSPILNSFQNAVLDKTNHGYPPYGGKETLKESIITFYKNEYEVNLTKEEITIFSGSLSAIAALPMILANPGQHFLLPDPSYFAYETAVRQAESVPYWLPLEESNHFFPKYEDIPHNILKNTAGLFINYPHNPTGKNATKSFFEETVAFAKKNSIPVIHDFAYADIYFQRKSPSFLEVEGAKDVGIELVSLSKTFNMAGWRIAFAVGNKELIAYLSDYIKSFFGGSFGAVQDALAEQLNKTHFERALLRDIYYKRRQVVLDKLKDTSLRVIDSEGTFFLWIQLPDHWDDVLFVDELLKNEYLAVLPGSTFGTLGKGFIRVSLVSDEIELIEGMSRLVRFTRRYKKYG